MPAATAKRMGPNVEIIVKIRTLRATGSTSLARIERFPGIFNSNARPESAGSQRAEMEPNLSPLQMFPDRMAPVSITDKITSSQETLVTKPSFKTRPVDANRTSRSSMAQKMRTTLQNLSAEKQPKFLQALMEKSQVVASKLVRHSAAIVVVCAALVFIMDIWTIQQNKIQADKLTQIDKAIAIKDWPQVLAESNEVIASLPNTPILYCYRGLALDGIGKSDAAIQAFDHALQLDPNLVRARSNRARSYLMNRRYEEALSDFNLVLAAGLKPEDPWNYANRGSALGALGKYAEALKDIEIACKLQPENLTFLKLRAFTEGRLNQFGEAEADLTTVIKKNPDPAQIAERAYIEFRHGEKSAAFRDLAKSLQLKPTAVAYYYRALIKRSKDRDVSSLSDLNKAVELAPYDSSILQERARCLVALKRLPAALQDYDRLQTLAAQQKATFCFKERAFVEKSAGNYRRSANDFAMASASEPSDRESIYEEGICREHLEQFSLVAKLCDRLIERPDRAAKDYTLRAKAESKLGHSAAAESDFKAALALDRDSEEALLGCAALDENKGDVKSARNKIERVLSLDAKNQLARLQLGELSRRSESGSAFLDSRFNKHVLIPSGSEEQLEARGYEYLRANQADAAVVILAEAVRRAPNKPPVRRYLAYALSAAAMPRQAVEQFKALARLCPLSEADKAKLGAVVREVEVLDTAAPISPEPANVLPPAGPGQEKMENLGG